MKKLLAIFTLMTLFTTACSNDEANTGERAETEWNNFIQKHLIGEWKPSSFVVKPLIGEPILQREYTTMGQPNDAVVLHRDFTGYLRTQTEQSEQKEIAFQWYHRIEELGIKWSNGLEIKAVIVHKSADMLALAFPLPEVLPYVELYMPELTNFHGEDINDLVLLCEFVK